MQKHVLPEERASTRPLFSLDASSGVGDVREMGREIEPLIEDIAFGGKGVGRTGGKAVFVPFTIAGETVTARIVSEKKSFAEAQLVTVMEASPHRVTPRCPYFGRCGGCSYQHMTYGHQLHWKTRQVRVALERIGKIAAPPIRPIVPSPRDYEYRNRITVHVENGTIGFYRYDSHRLLDIEQCPIAMPEVNQALMQLRARRPRDGHYTLRARHNPRFFSQTNDLVATHLLDAIAELLPGDNSFLVDAYCGAGFFAKYLLGKFSRVIGIDWDIHAIAAAQANASDRELYLSGDVALHLAEQLALLDPRLTTVIIDPPAVGLAPEVRKILSERPPARLFYISCNPPTLARDLADLRTRFHLESITPFDMFPQTAEIEALAHLTLSPALSH